MPPLVRWIILGGLALLAITVIAVVGALHGHSTGWLADKRPIADQAAFLEPHITVTRPEAATGSDPVMLIFSGCGGVRPHHADWARIASEEGYIGIVVDSMTPRGFSREEAQARVCSGTALWGRERASDVMAMMHYVQTLDGADPARIVLFGQSHGAWAVMDLMAMDFGRLAPTGLWPRPDPAVLAAVKGTILFYPYCGTFSLSPDHPWRMQPPTLMVLAENDTVVSPLACREVATRMESDGVPIVVDSYSDAGHSFDEFSLPENHPLKYHPGRASDAKIRVRRFLRLVKE